MDHAATTAQTGPTGPEGAGTTTTRHRNDTTANRAQIEATRKAARSRKGTPSSQARPTHDGRQPGAGATPPTKHPGQTRHAREAQTNRRTPQPHKGWARARRGEGNERADAANEGGETPHAPNAARAKANTHHTAQDTEGHPPTAGTNHTSLPHAHPSQNRATDCHTRRTRKGHGRRNENGARETQRPAAAPPNPTSTDAPPERRAPAKPGPSDRHGTSGTPAAGNDEPTKKQRSGAAERRQPAAARGGPATRVGTSGPG
ncbi:hypothetical protein OPQ81_008007 [Rhizoctonia solani]|nr:hypothetical protein OPQ81_008007 [Rhizoctonia solani]